MTDQKRKRITYSKEFKDLAIEKCGQIGVKEASKELGVTAQSLNSWILKAKASGSSIKAGPSYEELEKELRRVKRELSYVYDINRVLKKSVGIFSQGEMGGSK